MKPEYINIFVARERVRGEFNTLQRNEVSLL